jgi:hypothetical protein
MMPDLEFVKALPRQAPSELMVYSTERARAGRDTVLEMTRKLRLPDIPHRPEFRYVDNWTIGRHGAYTIALNRRSGAMRFRDEVRHGRELDVPFRIAEPRAIDISREFVEKTELLKQPARDLKVGKIAYLRTQGASTNGEVAPEQILDAGVIFTREIDGIPVAGFGGYMMVNVAPDESVVATVKIWRHRDTALGMVKVLEPDYGVEALQKRLSARGLEGSVKVLKADFCYFEAGDDKTQRFLEPTYAFVFETRVGEFLYKSIEVIPATRQPRQRWIFRKRFPAPAVVRE